MEQDRAAAAEPNRLLGAQPLAAHRKGPQVARGGGRVEEPLPRLRTAEARARVLREDARRPTGMPARPPPARPQSGVARCPIRRSCCIDWQVEMSDPVLGSLKSEGYSRTALGIASQLAAPSVTAAVSQLPVAQQRAPAIPPVRRTRSTGGGLKDLLKQTHAAESFHGADGVPPGPTTAKLPNLPLRAPSGPCRWAATASRCFRQPARSRPLRARRTHSPSTSASLPEGRYRRSTARTRPSSSRWCA